MVRMALLEDLVALARRDLREEPGVTGPKGKTGPPGDFGKPGHPGETGAPVSEVAVLP